MVRSPCVGLNVQGSSSNYWVVFGALLFLHSFMCIFDFADTKNDFKYINFIYGYTSKSVV